MLPNPAQFLYTFWQAGPVPCLFDQLSCQNWLRSPHVEALDCAATIAALLDRDTRTTPTSPRASIPKCASTHRTCPKASQCRES